MLRKIVVEMIQDINCGAILCGKCIYQDDADDCYLWGLKETKKRHVLCLEKEVKE